VFRGTRVPFKIFIEYLEGGDTLDQFLEQYPSVSRELAIAGGWADWMTASAPLPK
jgi:uncharacterized protein (DUF433 family)